MSARLREAQALLVQGRVDEAEAVYRALLDAGETPEVLHLLAMLTCQQGRHEEAAALAQRACDLRPQVPELMTTLALALHRCGRLEASLAVYERAFAIDSESAESNVSYGWLLVDMGDHVGGLVQFERAARLSPSAAAAFSGLRHVLALLWPSGADWAAASPDDLADAALTLLSAVFRQGPWTDAAAGSVADVGFALVRRWRTEEGFGLLDLALARAPDAAVVWLCRAGALLRSRRPDEAMEALQRTLDLCAGHADARHRRFAAQAHLLRASHLLAEGRWAEGWAEYEWRLPYLRAVRRGGGRAWEGEPLCGQHVLVHAEQGMGDTIQFARFVDPVVRRGGRPVLECHPSLVRLMATLTGVERVVPSTDEPYPGRPRRVSRPRCRLRAALMSLPHVLGVGAGDLPADVPYLHPPAAMVDAWRDRLAGLEGRRVGLAWAGNPAMRDDRDRSCGLASLAPLARLEGVRFVSLQVGAPEPHPASPDVVDVSAHLADFLDTAALMRNLDAVVAVDTAVAHLAGALALPTFTLVRYSADWRWAHGASTTPWYPTMRLFHQPRPMDWSTPVAQVAAALARQLGSAP